MTQDGNVVPVLARTDDGAPAQKQVLEIRFTGSGSEYFRIWIVNLLLTLVTLTLYIPFARARRIAYFQNNTLVGGDPLGFHADPWKMFRGYLLVLALGVGYWAVSKFLPGIAWIVFLVLMLLWPALWRASLQFRLRNTSWRGVRFSFEGDLKSAYLTLLPFFLPALIFVLFLPALPQAGEENAPQVAQHMAAIFGGVVMIFMALTPWMLARLKRFQHGGYAFAQERTQLHVGTGRFYTLSFKTSGVTLVAGALIGILGVGAAFLMRWVVPGMQRDEAQVMFTVLGVGAMVLIYLLMPLLGMPYFGARFQNLLWNGTRSTRIAFVSSLRFRDLFRVTLLNWLLIVVTLGLYWPFARVRAARLKLEAVAVKTQGDVNEWVSRARQSGRGVLGDAAGDFFGIDMGL